jgi:glycosyltransferase involved in cell wall biosynthesis
MRVLLLNQTFYPDVAATAQHAADLAAGLADAGHEVTVVASRRAYDGPPRMFPARERWRDVEIMRVPSTALGKSARWRRAIDFASFLLACMVRLAMLPRFDVVIAMTSPPLIGVLAALFVRLKGGALVSWIMDLNPDEAIAAGALRRESLAARGLARLLRFSLETSTGVVVLDRFMRDRVIAKGVSERRVAILPPWSHSSVVHHDERGRERFRASHGLTGKFVVMYSGNHSPCHPLDTVLEAARAMRDDTRAAFVFIGGGSEFRKVADSGLDNVVCLPYQPLDTLAGSLSAGDLHVVVMGEPFVGIVHPCKIYNVLAVGSPCLYIGPRPSHVTELAADSIYCTGHGDVAGVVDIIRRNASLGARRWKALDEFSAASLVPAMIAMIEEAGRARAEDVRVAEVVS